MIDIYHHRRPSSSQWKRKKIGIIFPPSFYLFKTEGLLNVFIVGMKGGLEESLLEILKRKWEELRTGFPEIVGIDDFKYCRKEIELSKYEKMI